jgi:hypothetical protein
MLVRNEVDRKALDRIADRVYGPRPKESKRPLAEPYTDGEDDWATVIRNFVYRESFVLMDEIGRHVSLKFGLASFGKRERDRIGAVLRSMGWKPDRNKKARGFRPAGTVTL